MHDGLAAAAGATFVDFNRSGVPLVEIVTAPDLRSGVEAAAFFRGLRAVLVALGVNDGNMEEGSLRCDANVSVRAAGSDAFGTKVELKNLNSFRYVQKAIDYEAVRQAGVLRGGGRVGAETRLWDADAGRSVAMRSKEEAHDYRYFPEPDLPPLQIAAARVDALRESLPELPPARRARFVTQYGLAEDAATLLAASTPLARYFEEVARESGDSRAAAEWVRGELLRRLDESGLDLETAPVGASALGTLIRLTGDGTVSAQAAKKVFGEMFASGEAAGVLIDRLGVRQLSDRDMIVALVRGVLADHAGPAGQYRAGKAAAFGFLVGAVMKASGGRANPRMVEAILRSELDARPDS